MERSDFLKQISSMNRDEIKARPIGFVSGDESAVS